MQRILILGGPGFVGRALWAQGMPEMVLAAAMLAALAGCGRPARPPATPTSAAAPAARTVDAQLRRFECDEKCWLEIELHDGRVVSGVCNAAICVRWLDDGERLPVSLVARRAHIKLRQTPIFIGTEEDRMEAEEFRDITVLK